MANIRSAQKRNRQSVGRTARNRARMNRIRTYVKQATQSFGSEAAGDSFRRVMSELHRGVRAGVLHKRTAARKISRLHRMLKSADTAHG